MGYTKEDIAIYKKKYRDKHKEEIAAKGKKYYEDNKEETTVRKKAYYEYHKKEVLLKCEAYRKEHKEEAKVYKAAYAKTAEGKTTIRRHIAKRKRQLGYNVLIPLKEGEDAHHITNEDVLGVPATIHQQLSGHRRKKHRTLVLQWLKGNDKRKYKIALCALVLRY